MSTRVVVYSRPGCVQCDATCRALDKAGVEYEVVDVDQNSRARELLEALDYRAAPVVTSGDRWWSGFRPDEIKALA